MDEKQNSFNSLRMIFIFFNWRTESVTLIVRDEQISTQPDPPARKHIYGWIQIFILFGF